MRLSMRLIPLALCVPLAFSGCAAPSVAPEEPSTTDALGTFDIADKPDDAAHEPAAVGQPSFEASPDDVKSAYDLKAILSIDPREIPDVLERLGFTYEEGAPWGWWEAPTCDLPLLPANTVTRVMFTQNGGETSPDLMRAGRRPPAAAVGFTGPYAQIEEAEAVAAALLERTGLGDEAYANTATNEKFGHSTITHIGRCPEGSAAAVWQLWIFIQPLESTSGAFEDTTYALTVFTEEGALASESEDM